MHVKYAILYHNCTCIYNRISEDEPRVRNIQKASEIKILVYKRRVLLVHVV
jgi:hypothetical protein